MKRISLCLCTLLVSLSAFSQGIQDYCTLDSLKYKGDMRHYWIHVPEKLSDAAPLMVCLHGYGGDAVRKSKVQLVELADREGFVVCFPQGLRDPRGKTGWNVGYPAQEGMKPISYNKPVILHKYLDGKPARHGKGHATEVWLYEVQGGTHSWSDKEMDTYAQIWSFMSRFMY